MSLPRILAMYLPQFHEIPENNEWWGKGFTEWTSVKNARPLFSGHNEPRVPYESNYYNLLDEKTLMHQADLMHQYGVDGLCFYHYWFQGRQLLEKPAELLLKSPDIPMVFCFSWANQTWSRTWYGAKKETLLLQEYGDEESWKTHFDYLLPFFQDSRYIKVDNAPVFVIYRPFEIERYGDMIQYFKKRAVSHGFSGLYIVESLTTGQTSVRSDMSDACFFYEPWYTLFGSPRSYWRNQIHSFKKYLSKYVMKSQWFLNFFDYDAIYSEILSRKIDESIHRGKKVNIGCFVDLDDTPRRKELGVIFKNTSPAKFQKHFSDILQKSKEYNSDFIFITAWNEWAEGAHLEPDNTHGYAYLEALLSAKNTSL